MKKLIVMVVAAAVAIAVQAIPTWATINTVAYTKDSSAGDNAASYSAYLCLASTATTLFGGSDVTTIEEALMGKFSSDVPQGATAFSGPYYDLGQYTLDSYTGSGYSSSDYIAIAFYGDTGFRVFGAGSATLLNGSLVFDDGGSSAASLIIGAWQTVPEPTSGLLFLLGLSGLALKRKKA